LPWTLNVWSPNKVTLRATYTQAAPGGISAGGFAWENEGNGNCVQMEFEAVPTQVDIQPRDIVQLLVDGVESFAGVVERPPQYKPYPLKFNAVGLKKLLEGVGPLARRYGALANAGLAITGTAGGTLNRDGYRVDLHPAITYDAAKISSTLPALATWNSGSAGESLAQILDALAGAANSSSGAVQWGVGADMKLFFGVPSTTPTVLTYAASGWDRLPVVASDTVSRVAIVLSSKNGQVVYSKLAPSFQTLPNIPEFLDPIIYKTPSDSNHVLYNQEKTFPTGNQDWFEETYNVGTGVFSPASGTNMTNEANAYDGNSTTYANNTAAAPYATGRTRNEAVDVAPGNFYGVQLIYSSVIKDQALQIQYRIGITQYTAIVGLPSTSSLIDKNLVRIYFATSALVNSVSFAMVSSITVPTAADQIRVWSLAGLKTSARLDDYAKSFIKLPAPVAAQINLNNITVQTPQVQVTTVPVLGTVTALAPSWKYTLTRGDKGRSTTAQLGSRQTSNDAQVVLQTVKNLDARNAANARAQSLPSVLP
jgi:hypothetical protein